MYEACEQGEEQREEDDQREDQKKKEHEEAEWDMKGNGATVERLTDESVKEIGVNVNCLSAEWEKNVNGVNVKCLNFDSFSYVELAKEELPESCDHVERLLADWSEAGEEEEQHLAERKMSTVGLFICFL